MKIGVLNECFLSTSQVRRLESIGDVEINIDTNTKEKAIERIKDKDIILVDKFIFPLTKEVLDNAKNLKLIVINSTGYDDIDIDYLNDRGIKLQHTPDFSTDSVAEQVFALFLSVARKIVNTSLEHKNKPFEIFPDEPKHIKFLGMNLRGKTLGVIGTGNIGKRVLEIGGGLVWI